MSDPSGQGCQPYTALAVGTTNSEVGQKSGKLCGIVLHPAAAACSVKVYSGQTVQASSLIGQLFAPSGGADAILLFTQFTPMYAGGWTAVIAGTGATADIYTKPLN